MISRAIVFCIVGLVGCTDYVPVAADHFEKQEGVALVVTHDKMIYRLTSFTVSGAYLEGRGERYRKPFVQPELFEGKINRISIAYVAYERFSLSGSLYIGIWIAVFVLLFLILYRHDWDYERQSRMGGQVCVEGRT